jgi:HD superfamily phosphodiesterase
MDFGCAAHCKFAEHCFGELPPELLKQKQDLFKDRLAVEMKLYFKQDFRRIGHSAKVARYAEKLVTEEKGDPAVVLSAAYLHDIGVKEVERKHNSSASQLQEEEGPPVAREILSRLDAPEPLIEEVCDIIGHHHNPRPEETVNFKVVYDADLLVNLEERRKKSDIEPQELEVIIERSFLTATGRELARSVFFNGHAAAAQ